MYAESTPANTKAEMKVTIITSSSEKPRSSEARCLRSLIRCGESIFADVGHACAGICVARYADPANGETHLQYQGLKKVWGAGIRKRLDAGHRAGDGVGERPPQLLRHSSQYRVACHCEWSGPGLVRGNRVPVLQAQLIDFAVKDLASDRLLPRKIEHFRTRIDDLDHADKRKRKDGRG